MQLNLKIRKPKVFYPKSLENDSYCGKLIGYSHSSTSIYNIVFTDEFMAPSLKDASVIGEIINIDNEGKYFTYSFSVDNLIGNPQKVIIEKPLLKFGEILALRQDNRIEFYTDLGVKCNSESYSLINDVFSRNVGILETDIMLKKTAIITGCGSVGSLIALELARAGVGNFFLIDADIFSYHNLCRHQCAIEDVGKFKIDAVANRILHVNPTANIIKSLSLIEEVPEHMFNKVCDSNTIIVGCTDNREGNVYANLISKIYKIPFIATGLWERAFAGEIFYTLPDGNPCYKCFYDDIGKVLTEPSEFKQFYFEEEDVERLRFEPGISVDINFVTIIAVKLMIDILNIDNPNYIPKVINYLSQFTLICNTNDERVGGENASFFSSPLQISPRKTKYCNECEKNKICILN